jgi:hypothetical protein
VFKRLKRSYKEGETLEAYGKYGKKVRTYRFLVESYLNPGSRVVVENLIVSQPDKKSPAFYVTRTIIKAFVVSQIFST